MRLDKFLKVSRIIKRRTVAKEASATDKILVNSRVAKPSTRLKVGDVIEINYYQKKLIIEVKSLDAAAKKEDSKEMYEIIEIETS
ncbi:MAG: S4 domain-containing protein [Bacilli bacterium]|jgi:ribosomal 50S subunit-recycling heat shock protein|nr:S4 domain-containing protein [Bacillota bacterium]NLM31519.1 RNA-binding S4 domain-containing protein [Acholeplasmataceae bacterium]HOA77909.1 S4 domain-containing protein [Bacilli bacterium]HPZ26779.1 S4 domain-containing protein [Bacilli bacterium]HQC89248.1 S4 domain-containing protein [Bacilli bacterium]